MPSEEKQKINVWIPGSLWKQVETLGNESPTKATIAAFEALVLLEEKGSNQEALGSTQEKFRKLQEEIGRYQEIIIPNLENKIRSMEENLSKAPDLVEFIQLQTRYEGLQEIIREKDKSIERLDNDLIKAGQREEDLKQIHNNYMVQIQHLINQKAIGSPKEETRKFQKESKPASRKEDNTYNHVVQEKQILKLRRKRIP